MLLQCPIKRGIKVKKWYTTNSDLKSLADFKLCISQNYGEYQRDYQSIGIPFHNGLDIVYEDGTEVFASHDGTAIFTEDSMKGLGVVVQDSEKKTIYWHLKESPLPKNQWVGVKKGELIGYGDSTGFSTGSHLHYGLKLLNPDGTVKDRNNGVDGAIDPLPHIVWWDNMTEKEVKQLQALEGYSDPEGVAYWTGKPLSEYLKARLPDKIKTINASL